MLRVSAGLQLARLADLPKDVLTQAGKIAHSFGDEATRSLESSESSKVARRRKAVLKVGYGTPFANLQNVQYLI
jgi:DNA mismatch repair ATPase MutS